MVVFIIIKVHRSMKNRSARARLEAGTIDSARRERTDMTVPQHAVETSASQAINNLVTQATDNTIEGNASQPTDNTQEAIVSPTDNTQEAIVSQLTDNSVDTNASQVVVNSVDAYVPEATHDTVDADIPQTTDSTVQTDAVRMTDLVESEEIKMEEMEIFVFEEDNAIPNKIRKEALLRLTSPGSTRKMLFNRKSEAEILQSST